MSAERISFVSRILQRPLLLPLNTTMGNNRWHLHLLLLMPDHLHALISFPKVESMQQVIRSWKHYLAKQHRIEWQRDYFDHRLRSDESHEEKADYIRQNPVRAGLIASPELWPYLWEPDR